MGTAAMIYTGEVQIDITPLICLSLVSLYVLWTWVFNGGNL